MSQHTETHAHTPDTVAVAAQLACLLEASAEKPGNVTPTQAFHDTRYEDFLRSAVAIGPEMARAGERGVGDTILAAVQATRRWTRANTNLGIVLLFAPLAKAALSGNGELRLNLKSVLLTLTYDDARTTYAAIRLAAPGGLEDTVEHDVRDEPPAITLREAMAGAARRDQIAAEYLNDFATIFKVGLPALGDSLAKGVPTDQAVIQTYLEILAQVPDTLIARKCDQSTAREVSTEARAALTAGGVFSDKGRRVVSALDSYLRRRSHNQLNPGTTADLVAATLFTALLQGVLI